MGERYANSPNEPGERHPLLAAFADASPLQREAVLRSGDIASDIIGDTVLDWGKVDPNADTLDMSTTPALARAIDLIVIGLITEGINLGGRD